MKQEVPISTFYLLTYLLTYLQEQDASLRSLTSKKAIDSKKGVNIKINIINWCQINYWISQLCLFR